MNPHTDPWKDRQVCKESKCLQEEGIMNSAHYIQLYQDHAGKAGSPTSAVKDWSATRKPGFWNLTSATATSEVDGHTSLGCVVSVLFPFQALGSSSASELKGVS